MKYLYLALILLVKSVYSQIQWQPGNWAHACDFKGNDLTNVPTSGADCGPRCMNTDGCTHFTWSTFNGGTCWMKKGPISLSAATYTGDQTMVCGIVNPKPDLSGSVQFSITNRCRFSIWVGFQGRSRSDPNWKLPFNGGWEMAPAHVTNLDLPKDLDASRIWARTGCSNVNGQFRCETGDCGPWVQCAWDNVQRGGQTPATLAEFTLNGWGNQDYYDVSLVDGYNLEVTIRPKNPNQPGGAGQYWCTTPSCTRDLNSICPPELRKLNAQGQVVGCLSACEKFNTDQYCCRGAHSTPETCRSSNWPVNYPAIFKQACPTAYSYAYDDTTSTFFCKNTGYDIIFC